ncbi:C40 family peptidase [Brevibacterium luteolum]|uniref:C40 family peptidase n=1 Tax=Brevibacterium luteolum TaxID=199591 RepID=UPI00223A6D9F|nr:NlpC/P60 family protein [Brevibacterium luteolum]MCT1830403.1 NlpC/P60 family protein [Brevibacterium luteolum]
MSRTTHAPLRRRYRTVLAAAVLTAAGLTGVAGPAAANPLADPPQIGHDLLPRPPIKQIEVDPLTGHVIDTNPAADPPLKPGSGLHEGKPAFVDVAVATVWTDSSSPRKVDQPALANPVKLDEWNANLKDTEVRRGLTGKTQTQALYGDEVRVLSLTKDWAKVAVRSQSDPGAKHGYEGWMPRAQLVGNPDFGKLRGTGELAVVKAVKTAVSDAPGGKAMKAVSTNTELPVLTRSDDAVRVRLPNGTTGWVKSADVRLQASGTGAPKPKPTDLTATAKRYEGIRYMWAGTSQYGFDCSGFTYAVFRSHGIDIPRDSGPQSKAGKSVKASQLQHGDLIFFANRGGKGSVHHVGMYIGGGKMIHAPNASKNVEIVDWKKWDRSGQFAGAKRYL